MDYIELRPLNPDGTYAPANLDEEAPYQPPGFRQALTIVLRRILYYLLVPVNLICDVVVRVYETVIETLATFAARGQHVYLSLTDGRLRDFYYSLPVLTRKALLQRLIKTTLGITHTRPQFFAAWTTRWLANLNPYYTIAFALLIEILTGLPSHLTMLLLQFLHYLSGFISYRVALVIVFTIALAANRVFVLWLTSLVRVTGRPTRKYDVSGLAKKIRETHSDDHPSVSHASCSRNRNDAFVQCITVCQHFGLRPYFVSKSRRAHELGLRGSTYSFLDALQDINDPHVYHVDSDIWEDGDMLCFIDRDYYYDMNQVLITGVPVVLYTFDPTSPADTSDECRYRFDDDGKVIGAVKGGKTWSHYLWNYPDDIFRVSEHGITSSYKVYRYRCNDLLDSRSIIVLLPIGITFSSIDARLQYRNHVSGKTAIISSFDGDGTIVRVATIGSYDHFTLTEGEWDIVMRDVIARMTKPGVISISLPRITEILASLGYDFVNKEQAAQNKLLANNIYAALHGLDLDDPYDDTPVPYAFNIAGYHSNVDRARDDIEDGPSGKHEPDTYMGIDDNGNGYDERPKTGLESLAPIQLVDGAVFPARTEANMTGCIYNRITQPQTESMHFLDDDALKPCLAYLEEFTSMFLSDPDNPSSLPADTTSLTPLGEEEVLARMCRPSQRQDYEQAQEYNADHREGPTIFQKAENCTGDSRPITQIKGISKWKFAGYVYAITEVLKKQRWYAFGKSPRDVADRVAHICAKDPDLLLALTDYVRFDGHVSAWCRYVVRYIFNQAYKDNESYSDEVRSLTDENFYIMATTCVDEKRSRVHKYFDLNSGYQDTSNVGTLINAFVCYCALREMKHPCPVAWDLLGLYGGDDGVTRLDEIDVLARVVKSFGLAMEIEPILKDSKDHVMFLSRVYSPNVFNGCPDSCADLPRQLQKLLVTEKKGVPKSVKLWQKCFAHYLNDANTPILGEYCREVLSICADLGFKSPNCFKCSSIEEFYAINTRDTLTHWAVHALVFNAGFPNENEGHWMDDYAAKALPSFDRKAFSAALQAAASTARQRLAERADQLTAVISSTRKTEIKDYVLEPFTLLGSFAEISAFKKPGMKGILRKCGEEISVQTPGPNRIPDPSKLEIESPMPKDKVNEFEYYHKIVKGEIPPPFPQLTPGARKCLYVAARLLEDAKAQNIKLRNAHILYTGAYGEDIVDATKLLMKVEPCCIHLFDPAFQAPLNAIKVTELKALSPKGSKPRISVRASKFTDKALKEVRDAATGKKDGRQFPIIWLDDAFTGEPDADAKLMRSKFHWIEMFEAHCVLISLKIKGTTTIVGTTVKQPLPKEYFHTPVNSRYFTDVNELRLCFRPVFGEAPVAFEFPSTAEAVSECSALSLLHKYE